MNLIILLLINCLDFLVPAAPESAAPRLQDLINDFVQLPELRGADISVSLISISENQLIASFQPDRSLIPASSLKTVTTATALALLGPDYLYSTRLIARGPLSEGTLNGDLVIRGSGDPSLVSRWSKKGISLEQWGQQALSAIRKAGIQRVNGRIIADELIFDPEEASHASWEERDMGNYYGTGVWGLNIHDNLYYLHFRQNPRLGGKPTIEGYSPEVPGLNMGNQVTSAGKNTGDNAYIYGKPYQFYRKVTGTIPAGNGRFTIKGSFPDAPLFAAQYLAGQLKDAGIAWKGEPTTRRKSGFSNGTSVELLLKDWKSPPLATLAERANVNSDNLYCESFLFTIGRAAENRGSRSAGLRALRKFWADRGLNMDQAQIVDGSGLSEANQISSRLLASILRKAYADKKIGPAYLKTLPRVSNSTYLSRKFKGTPAQYRLYAKSGSMEEVRTYSGLFQDKAGKWYSFSILANSISGQENRVREKIESLMLSFCQ